MKKLIFPFGFILFIILLSSFVQPGKKPHHLTKQFKNTYAYVEPGTLYLNNESLQLGNYYISTHEVSNAEYKEFLTALEADGPSADLTTAQIDTAQWETVFKSNPMTTCYHQHPAYRNYPVVNITYEAAQLYCQWLTAKSNLNLQSEYTYEYKLPNRTEWMRAAEGKLTKVDYAWGGSEVFNLQKCVLCNIDVSKENNGLVDATTYTAQVESYSPNSIGLYNVNGNVAEMTSTKGEAVGGSWNSTATDAKISSVQTYTSASPLVGFRPIIIVTPKVVKS